MGSLQRIAPLASILFAATCFATLAAEGLRTNAVVVDEFALVPAGVSHWQVGRFSLYRATPPLVRTLTALPVWLSGARVDYSRAGVGHRSEWNVGLDFLRANVPRYQDLFARSRSVVVLLAVACGVLIARWTWAKDGPWPAVVASMLWFTDPNVLAHSGFATTDVGAAFFGLLAVYFLARFIARPSTASAVAAGIVLGLAQASKFSLLALYPAFLALVLIAAFAARRGAEPPTSPSRSSWLRFAIVLATSVLVLNAVYLFDGTVKPLGGFAFKSRLLSGSSCADVDRPRTGNRFVGTWASELPVPLPKDYLLGVDTQLLEMESLGFARLEGGHLVRGGRWYSPLRTLAYKLPLGTMIIALSSCIFLLRRRAGAPHDNLVLAISTFALLVAICSATSLNWPVRYSLPALPLLLILTGRAVRSALAYRAGQMAVAACLAWNATSVLSARPFYLSYGNEIVGGAAGARDVCLGSDFDWGQDLLRLKQWAVAHPEARPLALACYGVLDGDRLGIQTRGLPESFLAGGAIEATRPTSRIEAYYLAISSNVLHGLPTWVEIGESGGVFASVRSPHLRPATSVARVGTSIFIFRIDSKHQGSRARGSVILGDLSGSLHEHTRDELRATP